MPERGLSGRGRTVAAALLVSSAASSVSAHPIETGLGPFLDGMARIAFTPEDALVVIAVSLLGGLGGRALARWPALLLPPAWLAGGFLGAAFPTGGELAWARTISFSLAGVLVALDARLPRAWLAGLACAAGVLHGYAAGATSAHLRGWQVALLGAGATVLIVAAAGSTLVVRLRPSWARIAIRVAGSWIAAAGLLMLGWLARGR